MNGPNAILMVAAFSFLIYVIILAIRIVAILIAIKRRTFPVFEVKPNLAIHLAFLLKYGKSYAADWKKYRMIKRSSARIKAEKNRTEKTTR